MLINLDEEVSIKTDAVYDVCIVGSGPAGISAALFLHKNGLKVAILEAGDMQYTNKSQDIYNCQNRGLEAWVNQTRLRYFGGTSNHWAGRCRPFEPVDFEAKENDELLQWPISYSDYMQFFKEACDFLDITGKFKSINEESFKGFIPDRFELSPPTRLNQKYSDLFVDSNQSDLYLNANLIKINAIGDNVESVSVSNYNRKIFDIKCKYLILAAGAVENAKILLNFNFQNDNNFGHKYGMVGKCFMEHLNLRVGEFIYTRPEDASRRQFFTDPAHSHYLLSNFHFRFIEQIRSGGRAAAIKDFLKNLSCKLRIEDKVQFISQFNCPGSGVISTLTEHRPFHSSYISLLDEKDIFGNNEIYLNWAVSDEDVERIRALCLELAKSFSSEGLGYIKLNDFITDRSKSLQFSPHAHHMGTTRMAHSEEFGVVDSNCKVFGSRNLFIAGSSVFSTGGACNPTLPLVQLSIRTANHILNI